MRLAIAALFTLIGLFGSAEACINEPNTKYEENQFRSRYKSKVMAHVDSGLLVLADNQELALGLGISFAGLGLVVIGFRGRP